MALLAALALLVPGTAVAIASDFEHPASTDPSQQFVPLTNTQRVDTPNDRDYDKAETDTQQADKSTNFYDEDFGLFGFPSMRTPSAVYHDGPNVGKFQVAGFNAAGAWKFTRGDPRGVVAILDTGIRWDNSRLREQIHLNTAELPYPQHSDGSVGGTYDLNGDGVVNVEDYKDDPRVPLVTKDGNGNPVGKITGHDLIEAFGHCQVHADHSLGSCPGGGEFDNDGNGYANDIAGWDFFDDDNDPGDTSSYFAAENHGSGRAEGAAEKANDGDGSLGVCPHCQIMPLRIWDTFVSDGNTFGQAIVYGTDNGAKVIEGSNGSTYHSAFTEHASQYAYDHGAVQTFSGDDLNTGNHNYPANYGHAMLIQGTVPDTMGLGQSCGPPDGTPDQMAQLVNGVCDEYTTHGVPLGTNTPVASFFRGANTTQYGGKSSISLEGTTGSENTGKASGAAGLVISSALEHGITLSPDETRGILEQTAEDVTPGNTAGTGTPDPSQPGWDTHFGWGRVNLGAAVAAAADANKVPPEASIDSPDWYAPLTGTTLHLTGRAAEPRTASHQFHYTVEWGPGLNPTDAQYASHLVKSGTATSLTDLGTINLDDVRTELASPANVAAAAADPGGPTFAPNNRNPYQDQFSVRLVVTDPNTGARLHGVDRRAFTALPAGQSLRPGYPKRMGTGGEAQLRYADLNGDNVPELIAPMEDGTVHAYEPNGSELPGWPVHTAQQFAGAAHLNAPGMAEVTEVAPQREPPRGPTVADLDGDGIPEIVIPAGIHLNVWEPDGSMRPGFPVTDEKALCDPSLESHGNTHVSPHVPAQHAKCGFLSTAAIAHLEGPGKAPDIVQPALDGHVYAFRPDGSPVPHFPVLLNDTSIDSHDRQLAELISAPAIADLNKDGFDDIVEPSNEAYDTDPSAPKPNDVGFAGVLGNAGQTTRVYAISGKAAVTGQATKLLPGWPIKIPGLIQDVLPLVGPSNDPSVLNVGGAPEVAASATSGTLALYKADGSTDKTMRQELYSPTSNATDKSPAFNLFEGTAIGKLQPAGPTSLVKYELSAGQLANLAVVSQNVPYNHLIGAWDAASGQPQPGYPTITDDYQFLSSSTIAKVDSGSSNQQVIAGTGLGLVHAYDGLTGQDQVAAFPKVTGGWLFSPAAISVDKRLAAVTREGYLFEWSVPSLAECQSEWPTFRHDPQNSGNYDRDGTAPAAPGAAELAPLGGNAFKLSFKSPGDDGFCGTATSYRTLIDGKPTNPADLGLGKPVQGKTTVSKGLLLPADGSTLTVQAVDEAGNVGEPVDLPYTAGPTGPGGGGGGGGGGGTGGTGTTGGTGGTSTLCKGVVPRSSISKHKLRATHRRIKLSGRSIEVDCVSGKHVTGKVNRVLVAVHTAAKDGRCRFLKKNGRLGRTRACNKPTYVRAKVKVGSAKSGKTLWSLNRRVRLPNGHYIAFVRGVDSKGHRETITRATSSASFQLR